MTFRDRLALALEALLWCFVLALAVYLVWDIAANLKAGKAPIRSVVEFLILGLLVWWPMVRTRIRFGYWMNGWDDTPASRFTRIDPHPTQPRRQRLE